MGDVVELRRQKCPCGWNIPQETLVNLHSFRTAFGKVEVQYTCPECGRRLEVDVEQEKPMTNERDQIPNEGQPTEARQLETSPAPVTSFEEAVRKAGAKPVEARPEPTQEQIAHEERALRLFERFVAAHERLAEQVENIADRMREEAEFRQSHGKPD